MNRTRTTQGAGALGRPVGSVQPLTDRATRALKAIRQGRYQEAQTHVLALKATGGLEAAWRAHLRGLLALMGSDWPLALSCFDEALEHLSCEDGSYACPRLAAASYEQIGWVHRRQERPQSALTAHTHAFKLRRAHGSQEELWESAMSLGHTAQLACRNAEAKMWFQTAIKHGSATDAQTDCLLASAYAGLATVLADAAEDEEAVEAARRALDHWNCHDPGSVQAARARLGLGCTLLRRGERLFQDKDAAVLPVLEEVVGVLKATRDELEAFGSRCASDLATCHELLDFAQRLAEDADTTK